MAAPTTPTLTEAFGGNTLSSIIPGQMHLMRRLGQDESDPFLDPYRVAQFRCCAKAYVAYLLTLAQAAIQRVSDNPVLYRDAAYADLAVDLNKTAYGMPFHIVHYGYHYCPTADAQPRWSRRAWSTHARAATRHPFRGVQHALANLGYTLLDLSVVGSAPLIRLYFRSPPSDEELAAVATRPGPSAQYRRPLRGFWHGMHAIPLEYYRCACDSVLADLASTPDLSAVMFRGDA